MVGLEAKDSPHVHQVLQSKGQYSSRTDMPFTRELVHGQAEKAQYRRRKGESKTVVHWGQRKLLMSEIEFLLEHGAGTRLVVYAGAAPGTHIGYLSEMFPEHYFMLFDPANFTVKPSDRIACRQEMFTDTVAAEFTSEECLFISDVRAADWQRMDEDETENQVSQDMQDQLRWHRIIQPKASLLKFRLSWKSGKTQYPAGKIFLPIWGPITTTEARLMCTGDAEMIEYDNTVYEQEMFFFNTVQRVALYPHEVTEGEGIDHCYDCKAEVELLRQYLLRRQPDLGEEEVRKEIAALSRTISRKVATNRTLLDENPDPEDRKRRINRRQYIADMPAYEYAKKRDRGDFEQGSTVSQFAQREYDKMRHGTDEKDLPPSRDISRGQQHTQGIGYDVKEQQPWKTEGPKGTTFVRESGTEGRDAEELSAKRLRVGSAPHRESGPPRSPIRIRDGGPRHHSHRHRRGEERRGEERRGLDRERRRWHHRDGERRDRDGDRERWGGSRGGGDRDRDRESGRDRGDRERGHKDRGDRERGSRDMGDKDRGDRERGDKEGDKEGEGDGDGDTRP